MAAPTIVDIPHGLGRVAARERLAARVGDLPGHIPGGIAEVRSSWPTPDRMVLEVMALGQSVTATLDVEDTVVRATFVLPAMLSFMAGAIKAAVRKRGEQLLLK
jgi:hypothetical protein